MTNEVLMEKLDAGNPHVAPTSRYGGIGRVGEGNRAPYAAEASLRRSLIDRKFKRALGILVLTAGVASFCAKGGTTYVWSGATAANAPTNAYVWADAANWGGTDYPRTETDIGKLTGGTTRYVTLPDDLTVKEMRSGAGKTFFLGKNVTLVDTLSYSTYNSRTCALHADKVTVSGTALGVATSEIAADIDLGAGGNLTASGDYCGIRFDLYANSDSNVRSNAIVNFKTLGQGVGAPSFFAPNGTAEMTMNFNQTDGSPYLKRTSKSALLSVGTRVTGAGIPDGTWLKRNFEDGWIELSQAVTNTCAANALTFAAFSPVTYQHVNSYAPNGVCKTLMQTIKNRTEDSAILEIDTFTTGGSLHGFHTEANCKPWRVVLHAVKHSGGTPLIKLGTCDLAFAERADGKTPGMPQHNVFLYAQDYTDKQAVFTVTNGISASILSLSNIVIKVIKQGAGTLSTRLTADAATANTGSLVVEEGTFEILGTTDGSTAYVKSLTVKAGATLKLGATLEVDALALSAGATVEGPGDLRFTGKFSDLPSDFSPTFTGGAYLSLAGTDGPIVMGRPASPSVPGDPAFWVRTDDWKTDMVYSEEGSVTNVTRWNDCRGTDAKYNFATNYAGCPTLGKVSNCRGLCLKIDKASSWNQSQGLVWARPITGIKSVFLVWETGTAIYDGEGGGAVLGWTDSDLMAGDFVRLGKPLFYSDFLKANIRDAEIYVNGTPIAWNTQVTYNSYFVNYHFATLLEVHPARDGAKANAFGRQSFRNDLTGGQRIYECIIYTNALTYAEKTQIREYLSAKWFDTGANVPPTSAANRRATLDAATWPALNVTDGALDVGKIALESGTFAKKGAGELMLEDCVAPNGTVSVEGGKLYLRSYALTTNVLPYASSVHIHLDATATNSITWRDIDGKGKCVEKWKGVRGTTLRTASAHQETNAPLHRIVRDTQPSSRVKAGMPTVDMGPVITTDTSTGYGTIAAKVGQFMDYTGSSSIRSAFLLMGSARGGGCPLGYNGIYDGYNGGNSLVRAMGNETKTPLSDPATPISVKGKYHCNIDGSYLTPLGCAYLNGSRVNANTTGYSGDYDSFAVSTYVNPLKLSAFACIHYNNNFGGLDLCEAILSTKWHSPEEVKLVDAYLRQKWFGETTDGYRPAQIGTLNVAAGATVDAIGDAPVTVGALSGAGTVACAVAFAGDAAVFEVEVLADGSVAGPLTVPASLDLSKGGTIRLTGYTSRLKLGRYHLVATTAAPAGDWTLTGYAGRRTVRSENAADGLYLVVKPSGFSILLR